MSCKKSARAFVGIGLALVISGIVTANLALVLVGLVFLFLALKALRPCR